MNAREIPIRLFAIAVKYALRMMLCMPATLITASSAETGSRIATVSFAEKVADGRPWHVNVVEHAEKMEMTLFPQGSGVTDDLVVPTRNGGRPRTGFA